MKTTQKYEIGTEVKTLTGRNIKDGYVFEGTKGTVKSFNNKKNLYTITVKSIAGSAMDVDYQENELILANLDLESTDEDAIKTKNELEALLKKNKTTTIIGCGVVLSILIAAIISLLAIKDSQVMLIVLIALLAVVLLIGITMILIVSKNSKTANALAKRLEAVVLLEKEREIEEDKNSAIYEDIKKLKALLDEGSITPKDYETTKKQLLKKLIK